MRKFLALLIIVLAVTEIEGQYRMRRKAGQASALASLPLLGLTSGWSQFATYQGGFRIPSGSSNGHVFDSSPTGDIAYRASTNTMFISVRSKSNGVRTVPQIAEISVPAPVNSSNVTDMSFATIIQGLNDPVEGQANEADNDDPSEQATSSGLLVYGDRLIGTLAIGYDAANFQPVSHYSRPLSLTTTGDMLGLDKIWNGAGNDTPSQTNFTRFVMGYLANVPSEWQGVLGGPVVTGECCKSIQSNHSFGPGLFTFNPSLITGIGTSARTAYPLVYYPTGHQTLGAYDSAGPYYGQTTQVKSVVMVNNTRTTLFFGRRGTTYGYGDGLSDPEDVRIGTSCGSGCIYQYDPTDSSKSNHGYPYEYFVHAYDNMEFKAVRDGTKQPWEVVPYAGWAITFPINLGTAGKIIMTGASYDSANQHLYLNQFGADPDGFGNRGVVHRFLFDITP